MRTNWRLIVLAVLFVGPYLVFMGLGFLWLMQQGWQWASIAALISLLIYITMTSLLVRWTRSTKSLLPPIDWDAPSTFSQFDRQALALVEAEAERGEALPMASLTTIDTYIDTGRKLAARLSAHYNPLSTEPLDRVSVVEMLTALELVSEDLTRLCRQIPGGDLVTPGDWKKAVVAANYIQKASDIYTYLLPFFNPVTGLPRLASQQFMVKPAWKTMQQNALRWFYRAYVNRLGTHLIELFSGRLVIGSDRYRKLSRHGGRPGTESAAEFGELSVALVGGRNAGKSRLIEVIRQARFAPTSNPPTPLPSAASAAASRLATADLIEVEGYHSSVGKESARDRSSRKTAITQAVEADLVILVIDGRSAHHEADRGFVHDWNEWYTKNPGLERPPIVAVVTHVDDLATQTPWSPPEQWATGDEPRDQAIRQAVESATGGIEPKITEVYPVALAVEPPWGIQRLMAGLNDACRRAERVALIRHLHLASKRSKAGRLVRQIGQHGQSLWKNFRSGRSTDGTAGPAAEPAPTANR